jgi:hypothetical protein
VFYWKKSDIDFQDYLIEMKSDLSKFSERNSNLFFKYLESNYIGISVKFPPETWAFYSLKGSILCNYLFLFLEQLQLMMHELNPYVEIFKNALEIIEENEVTEIGMRIITDHNNDQRRYNISSDFVENEVTILIFRAIIINNA